MSTTESGPYYSITLMLNFLVMVMILIIEKKQKQFTYQNTRKFINCEYYRTRYSLNVCFCLVNLFIKTRTIPISANNILNKANTATKTNNTTSSLKSNSNETKDIKDKNKNKDVRGGGDVEQTIPKPTNTLVDTNHNNQSTSTLTQPKKKTLVFGIKSVTTTVVLHS